MPHAVQCLRLYMCLPVSLSLFLSLSFAVPTDYELCKGIKQDVLCFYRKIINIGVVTKQIIKECFILYTINNNNNNKYQMVLVSLTTTTGTNC